MLTRPAFEAVLVMVSHPLDSRRVLKGGLAVDSVDLWIRVSHPLDSRRVLKVAWYINGALVGQSLTPPRLAESTES